MRFAEIIGYIAFFARWPLSVYFTIPDIGRGRSSVSLWVLFECSALDSFLSFLPCASGVPTRVFAANLTLIPSVSSILLF